MTLLREKPGPHQCHIGALLEAMLSARSNVVNALLFVCQSHDRRSNCWIALYHTKTTCVPPRRSGDARVVSITSEGLLTNSFKAALSLS